MKTRATAMVSIVAVSLAALFAQAADPDVKVQKAKERIGVYDSRSVAVAFGGSEPFNKWMAPLVKDMEKAKADGDKKKEAEVEAAVAARQNTMQKQMLSKAPVDNILAEIKGLIPGIKEKAGVTALVSKWDADTLAKHQGAEQVDVTAALVDAFKPSDQQRKIALELIDKVSAPEKQAGKKKDQ